MCAPLGAAAQNWADGIDFVCMPLAVELTGIGLQKAAYQLGRKFSSSCLVCVCQGLESSWGFTTNISSAAISDHSSMHFRPHRNETALD